MPESKRTYESSTPSGMTLRRDNLGENRSGRPKKHPTPAIRPDARGGQDELPKVDIIHRLIDRIKTV